MPRSTSPTLDSLLLDCETQSAVDITLRDGSTKHFCTGDPDIAAFLSSITGHSYSSDLMRVGELKETLGQATNNVQVVVSNVNRLFGLNVAAPGRKTELADVVIRRLYRSETNPAVYELKHFFTGKTVNSVVDEKQVSFDVIPDTTAAGTCIATVTLSPNNGFKFPDVPDQSAPGSGDNPGTPIGGSHCFIGESKFIFFDGSEIPFAELYKRRLEFIGQNAARSFDKANRAVRGEIQAIFRHKVTDYLKVTFADGSVSGVTSQHPFFTPMLKYVEIGTMKPGDAVFSDEDEQQLVSIHAIEPVAAPKGIWVYNVQIGRWKNYSADNKRVHNKEVMTV